MKILSVKPNRLLQVLLELLFGREAEQHKHSLSSNGTGVQLLAAASSASTGKGEVSRVNFLHCADSKGAQVSL